MAANLPIKRKIEIAFTWYLIDRQTADPTFLPGFAIVCATTGRSPDDATPQVGPVIEPELPYISVGCTQAKEKADFPPGYGIKDATVIVYSKTHASDEPRAAADVRQARIAELFEDPDAMAAALNQPALATTPDTRRQTDFYIYAIEDIEAGDDHSQTTWEDELIAHLVCQGFDPDYE